MTARNTESKDLWFEHFYRKLDKGIRKAGYEAVDEGEFLLHEITVPNRKSTSLVPTREYRSNSLKSALQPMVTLKGGRTAHGFELAVLISMVCPELDLILARLQGAVHPSASISLATSSPCNKSPLLRKRDDENRVVAETLHSLQSDGQLWIESNSDFNSIWNRGQLHLKYLPLFIAGNLYINDYALALEATKELEASYEIAVKKILEISKGTTELEAEKRIAENWQNQPVPNKFACSRTFIDLAHQACKTESLEAILG